MIYGRVILKNSKNKSIPKIDGDQVFSAPWHCELFALTISLYEKEVFDWAYWTNELANKLKERPVNMEDDLDNYYSSWLEAIEELILMKEVTCLDKIKGEISTQMRLSQDDHH